MISDSKEEKIIWKDLFSISIPINWTFLEDDGVISLFDENCGVGVLQISFASKLVDTNSLEDVSIMLAKDFLNQQSYAYDVSIVHFSEMMGNQVSRISFKRGEDYWNVWHIVKSDNVALITYNCSIKDFGKEINIYNKILNSFHWVKKRGSS